MLYVACNQCKRRAPEERGQELNDHRTAIVDTNVVDQPQVADGDPAELGVDDGTDSALDLVSIESRGGVVHRAPLVASESTSSAKRTHSVFSHARRD